MRAIKAKKIRRAIYGDMSLRQEREYIVDSKSTTIRNRTGSLRALYQLAKRETK